MTTEIKNINLIFIPEKIWNLYFFIYINNKCHFGLNYYIEKKHKFKTCLKMWGTSVDANWLIAL